MEYKTVLLNSEAYSKMRKAKEAMANKTKSKISFSDLVNETFGKDIELLGLDSGLLAYVKDACNSIKKRDYVKGIILFGSVARGTYNEHSDIDLFIVVDDKISPIEALESVAEIARRLGKTASSLRAKRLPSSLNPMVVQSRQLAEVKSIYLDILDYGIVIYDPDGEMKEFMDSLRLVKHKRQYTEYGEVLEWSP
jgi:predicted nucleotidyltransferase